LIEAADHNYLDLIVGESTGERSTANRSSTWSMGFLSTRVRAEIRQIPA
jgi:hypothetical protein